MRGHVTCKRNVETTKNTNSRKNEWIREVPIDAKQPADFTFEGGIRHFAARFDLGDGAEPAELLEIGKLPDFRIDFTATAALIGARSSAHILIMSTDLQESSVPLAEISQGPNAFETFLDRNQIGVIVFAIALAIAAVGVVIYQGIQTSKQQTAGALLNKAEDLASLKAVVDSYADTVAAGSAMVLLADKQWTDGKQDESIATLRKFIASSTDHPALPTAKANLGAKLMAQGKSGDASKVFEELVSDPAAQFIAPYALIALGDIAKTGGDLDKAETSYTKAKTDFPDSSFAETANSRLAILKAKLPVEIEAPPAPPAAATPQAPAPTAAPIEVKASAPAPAAPIEIKSEQVPDAPKSTH
jgi:predicted negative regulator of RcsB-dependent stress response